jgi:hypothetical protein
MFEFLLCFDIIADQFNDASLSATASQYVGFNEGFLAPAFYSSSYLRAGGFGGQMLWHGQVEPRRQIFKKE